AQNVPNVTSAGAAETAAMTAPALAPQAGPAAEPSSTGAGARSSRVAAEPRPVLDPTHYSIKLHTPYQSLVRARQLMNEIALDLIAELGYSESIASEKETRTARPAGVLESRFFVLLKANEIRTVEIDLLRNVTGKFDVFLYGRDRRNDADAPNPDLPKFLPTVVALFDEAETSDRAEDHGPLGHFVFQLSYIQADQAMGILKALGYATVEFNKTPGATVWENLYEPARRGEARLPYIIKFIEGSKMSIMEPNEQPPGTMPTMQMPGMMGQQNRTTIPDIGGTFLHHMTAGEPEQRLLVVYDHEQPDSLQTLLNTLRGTIDVPARQVVLSALVVELNSQRARDLGLTFSGGNGRTSTTFTRDDKDVQQPFTFSFDSSRPSAAFTFNATLSALITRGEAEILSNPSVLVIDGRQARIQIGQQVPVVNSTATAAGITSSVEYFPVGIVLNIRPRINEQGTEVTMQVETIVSAVGQNAATTSAVFFAPTIDNRQVQTFVRVADNTPFIVGGLVSSNDTTGRSGVPFLSQVPGLGALFGRKTLSKQKKEVIVVLTPHIIPPQRPVFSYVLPKDSDLLDSFDLRLFRNAYRIRSEDVHDLAFLDDSDVFQALLGRIRARAEAQPSLRAMEPFTSLLAGRIPGEEILVRRMLWEIVMKLGISQQIEPARIRLFEGSIDPADPHLQVAQLGDRLSDLATSGKNTMELIFAFPAATTEHPFAQPRAAVSYESVPPGTAEKLLLSLNTTRPNGMPQQAAIVLGPDRYADVAPLDALRGVLVLKKLLALNAGVPLTLSNFQVGRQVIFPTDEDVHQATHVVDRDTARLFYEVVAYYPAFEMEFNRRTREALHAMGFDIER
nr:type II and III secretion system protein [Acidobacteriota bacterium]